MQEGFSTEILWGRLELCVAAKINLVDFNELKQLMVLNESHQHNVYSR